MDKADIAKFKKCEICGSDMGKVDFDTPLYCSKCISEMEKLNMSPERYKEYNELKRDLKAPNNGRHK